MWLEIVALLVLLCSLFFSWKLFAALSFLFCLLYRLITKNFDYWQNLGVPFKPGIFPWGSVDFLKEQKNNALHFLDMCNEFKDEKFFGFFMFGKPVLMVNDQRCKNRLAWLARLCYFFPPTVLIFGLYTRKTC